MKIQVAACRFCGQTNTIESEKELTEPQAVEQATIQCDCFLAIEYKKEKKRKETAWNNIEKLFGEQAQTEDQVGGNYSTS